MNRALYGLALSLLRSGWYGYKSDVPAVQAAAKVVTNVDRKKSTTYTSGTLETMAKDLSAYCETRRDHYYELYGLYDLLNRFRFATLIYEYVHQTHPSDDLLLMSIQSFFDAQTHHIHNYYRARLAHVQKLVDAAIAAEE